MHLPQPPVPPQRKLLEAMSDTHAPFLPPLPPKQPNLRVHSSQSSSSSHTAPLKRRPPTSPSLEVILKEGRLMWLYVSQNVHDATHTLIQTSMKCLYPPVPTPFKWIQLSLETISPVSLNPSTVCSIGLARACTRLTPSLVSLMSQRLPSK